MSSLSTGHPTSQTKRVRFQDGNSSNPTTSEDSAHAAADSDSESELSSSSEEPSSDSESEDDDESNAPERVVNLRANRGKKPIMKFDKNEFGPDIRVFLKEFLPQLKAANEELEARRKAGTLDKEMIDADDNENAEQYIEMDLGLGVLETKDPNAHGNSAGDSDVEMQLDDNATDVLGKLMGRAETKEAAGIQEVNTHGS